MKAEINKRLQYLVTQQGGQWKVLLDRYYGPYPDKDTAIISAVDAAQRAGKNGLDAEVLLGEDGRMNFLWKFGDPYPYTTVNTEAMIA